MVNGISSSTTSSLIAYLQAQSSTTTSSSLSGSDMFSKLSSSLGIEDGSDITADQLQDYIDKVESDDSADKGQLGFLKQLQSNFDTIAGEDGTISSLDMESNVDLLKPPTKGSGSSQSMSATDMYTNLLSDLGLDDEDEITEDDLDSYIEELQNSGSAEDQEKLGFLTQLQDNFTAIAGTDGTISATDLEDNVSLLQPPSMSSTSGISTDWLDISEITSEMLEPPIDLKV